ncbi:MAG TPA: DUF3592 domain-containing protein [Stellaceae bacterium]|nr:DUF3592 domain-containing protein [Stellaceae bacterium]
MFPVFGTVFTAFGILALPIGIYGRRRAKREQTWPKVKAVVRSAAIAPVSAEQRHRYVPKLTYEYTVAGKTFRGDRLGVSGYSDFSESYARDYIAKRAVGSEIEVNYDPADPARSVLEPGAGGCGPLLFCLVGVVFLAVGIGFMVAGT